MSIASGEEMEVLRAEDEYVFIQVVGTQRSMWLLLVVHQPKQCRKVVARRVLVEDADGIPRIRPFSHELDGSPHELA